MERPDLRRSTTTQGSEGEDVTLIDFMDKHFDGLVLVFFGTAVLIAIVVMARTERRR